MKKPTKIVISFLFILLFASMISTAIYMSFIGEKEPQIAEVNIQSSILEESETEYIPEETERVTEPEYTPEDTEQMTENEYTPEEELTTQPENISEEVSEIDWTQFSTMDFYDIDFPKIGVTAVTAPLGENIVSAFYNDIEESETVLYYGTTEENIQNLLFGEYDIVFSPALSDDLLSNELELIPISNEAIVFLVSQKNILQNLYLEDIQNIYSGKITNWENFTREDKDIIAYQKSENSLVQQLFYSFVLPREQMMTPPHQIEPNENHELEKVTSYYDGGEYAIGYDTYHYASDILFDYNIKMIAIDGIYPTKRNIKRGIYPIMTNYYAVVRANSDVNSPERTLVQYLTSLTGQKLIEQSGYIPIN